MESYGTTQLYFLFFYEQPSCCSVKIFGEGKNKKKKKAKFLVSEQEVAMPTTTETHHSGKILPFFSFYFFTPLKFNKKIN
jgi:hypothetical protein